jgi:hypothetical protein
MKVSFQADNDLNQTIIAMLLRLEPTIDFQTASGIGLHGLDDLTVLSIAASEGRVLVSHDQTTMPKAFAEFVGENTSAGLLIVPQILSLNVAVEELLMVYLASESEEWINRITYLPL